MADVRETPGVSGLPAVAVAIVAGDWGVLVGRRRDGVPPSTSPGGKIEPGESPEEVMDRWKLTMFAGRFGPGVKLSSTN
jgi:8-oxo-dGTP pyrophosphatase MutT (NUDIX family)